MEVSQDLNLGSIWCSSQGRRLSTVRFLSISKIPPKSSTQKTGIGVPQVVHEALCLSVFFLQRVPPPGLCLITWFLSPHLVLVSPAESAHLVSVSLQSLPTFSSLLKILNAQAKELSPAKLFSDSEQQELVALTCSSTPAHPPPDSSNWAAQLSCCG